MPRPRSRPILLIDDDREFRAVAARRFVAAGFEVVAARDGKEGLGYLLDPSAAEPLCIVLDLSMATPSGWDTFRVLRLYIRLSRIPVLVLSNDLEPEARGLVLGTAKRFSKNGAWPALLEAVRGL